ncbi:hypothetical protein FRC11_006994 [Ceratobasidium sp. 423]|nr:hypothetical protein FRC11_006994 [Ceratobasidium sp. 423]
MNFVVKIIKGKVRSDIFIGILHAMAMKDDKESCGMKGHEGANFQGPYYDDSCKKWFLLGGVGDPMEIGDNAKDVRTSITNAINMMEKATKVIALGVPVFILAVMPISATLKAEDLLTVHNKLINGLLE